MARFNLAINSFIAGEMSPDSRGRTDIPQYAQGCEELLNTMVRAQGGADRRPGSIYNGFTAYNDGGANNASELTATLASSYVRTFPLYASNGKRQLVIIRPKAQSATTTRFAMVADVDSGYIASATISWGVYGYVRTITAAQLASAQYTQAGDILVITIPGHPPIFYLYVDVSSGTVPALRCPTGIPSSWAKYYNPTSDGTEQLPFLTRNVLNSQNNGTMTIGVGTASTATTLTCSTNYFTSSYAGVFFRLNSGTASAATVCTSYSSATVLNVTNLAKAVTTGALGNSGTTSWEEAAWSDVRGWPISVTYHQQRLYYLMANGTVYASKTGNIFLMMSRLYEDDPSYSGTVVASDPYSFTVSSKEPPIGRWLFSAKNLQIGTLGREYISTGASATTPDVSAESAAGSAAAQPVRIGNALYFIQRAGQSVKQLTFNNDEDAYKDEDLNILSSHICRKSSIDRTTILVPRFTQLEAQSSNSQVLWAIDSNGGLMSCTIERGSNVFAWSYHELGGALSGEAPKVLSISVLPSNEGRHDDVFLAVARTINGSNTIHFERITRPFELEDLYNASTDIDDKPVYADCAVLVNPGSATTVCTGLSHLEGESVDVVADGHYVGRFTVASNQVDVGGSKTYDEFIVGLPYTSRIVTNSLEAGSQIGSAQGMMKRAVSATIRLFRTIGLRYGIRIADLNGTDSDTMYELPFTTLGGLGGVPIPLFTGDKRVDLPLGYDRSPRMVIEQTKSLPMSVAGIFIEGQTNA